MNKKAISPLIATVLLIAFAVAIGTMVVSFLIDSTKKDPCDAVHLGIEGSGQACYANQRITFLVSNKGSVPIKSMKILLINEKTQEISEQQLANTLEPAGGTKIDVPFETINPSGIGLKLIAAIDNKGALLYCTTPTSELKTTLSTC